jgi:hypothetical protein
MSRHRRTDPRLIAARERAGRAVALRTAGLTLGEVAAQLGYNSPQAVWYAIRSLLGRQESAVAGEYRNLNLVRLERMLMAIWPDVLRGEQRNVGQARKIIHEINEMVGVYRSAPVLADRVSHEGTVGVGITWTPDAEWMRKFAEAYDEVHPGDFEVARVPKQALSRTRGVLRGADSARDGSQLRG